MRIACIGNMNNIMFQMVRYLTDFGHDVTLFLLDEPPHFLPQADSFESVSNYKIVHLGWSFNEFILLTPRKLRRQFLGYEFYIGTDIAPGLLFKAGLKLDILIPHGSDLYEFPFTTYRNSPPQLWEIPKFITGKAQYKGISEVLAISADKGDELIEKPIRDITQGRAKRIESPPIVYLKQYNEAYIEKSVHFERFKEIRAKYKFIAFQHGAQDWSDRGVIKENRGNDILINAFGEYLKEGTNRSDSVLVLIEYGVDVEKSKKLIASIGITDNVIWLPKMSRKDLMAGIAMSDICIGELGKRYWYCYSCIYEFMAMKKPLIHHRNDAYFSSIGMDLYPMIDTNQLEIVQKTFRDYRINPAKYKAMGNDAFNWLQGRTEVSIEAFRRLIDEKEKEGNSSNIISNWRQKILAYYLSPTIVFSYFMYRYILFKQWVKKIIGKSK